LPESPPISTGDVVVTFTGTSAITRAGLSFRAHGRDPRERRRMIDVSTSQAPAPAAEHTIDQSPNVSVVLSGRPAPRPIFSSVRPLRPAYVPAQPPLRRSRQRRLREQSVSIPPTFRAVD